MSGLPPPPHPPAEPVAVPSGPHPAPAATGTPDDPVGSSWTEALDGQPSQAADVGFIAAGGNSLRAMRLAGLLKQRCTVEIPISLLLRDNCSLAQLRAFVAEAPRAPATGPEPAATRSGSPLAAEQRRLWLLARLHPDSWAYNVIAAVRLQGRLDIPRLRRALNHVAGRHDILRARICVDDRGEPGWEYAPRGGLPLNVRTVAGDLDAGALEDFVGSAAATVISLSIAPLARAWLLCSASGSDACLALVANHIVADQTTLDLLLAEVASCYSAAAAGRPPAARDPAPRYADYARRAAAELDSAGYRDDLAYWNRRLAGLPAELRLPLRRRRPVVPTFRGEATTRPLGAERSARLDHLLRERGLTLMPFVLACVATVAASWSGRRDIVLGVPVSRRRTLQEARLAGFLLGTLPVRLAVDENLSVVDIAARAMRSLVEGQEHAAPTFDAIVDHLGVRSRPGRNPIFQIWVNDLTGSGVAPEFAGLRAQPQRQPMAAALFDLNWYVWRGADGYELQLVRSVDLFPAGVAEALADQVTRLAIAAIAEPGRPAREFDLAPADLAGVLPDAAVPLLAPSGDGDPAAGILAMAATRRAATAIVAPGGSITYAELGGAIRRTARSLAGAGVPAGAIVEICARRDPGYPVALLGTWLHGGCPALVDAATPAGRGRAIRSLIRPSARLDPSPDRSRGPELTVLDRTAAGTGTGTGLSHVLFTSGSTGRPLGVRVPHGPLAGFLRWYITEFGLGPDDRFCLIAGPGHDPVLRDMLAPLLCGGQLHIPPPHAMSDPSALYDWLARSRITVLHATPALLELLLAAGGQAPRHLVHLRLLVSAGALFTAGLARRIRAVTDATLVNAYGTTETPQIAACHVVAAHSAAPPGDIPDDAALPVGRGVAGHQLLVLTPGGSVAAPGQRGEIVVRSGQLATGYLSAGAEGRRFQPDRAGVAGIRWFHTGDLGHFDLAGRVVVTGRADRQVSIDGFRLELGEVENAALAHPDVRAALAYPRDTTAGQVLALEVVPEGGRRSSGEALRGHLRDLLPRHAVPSTIVVVDRLRLNMNHKPEAGTGRAPAPAGRDEPSAAVDERLASLAREVLRRPIGPDENFFDAGMTSMTLVRFHEALVRQTRLDIPVTALFTHVTLRALAAYLDPAGTPVPAADGRGRPQSLDDIAAARRRIRARLRDGGREASPRSEP